MTIPASTHRPLLDQRRRFLHGSWRCTIRNNAARRAAHSSPGTGFTAQVGAQGHLAADPAWQATLDTTLLEANGQDPGTIRQSWNEEGLTFTVAASGGGTPPPAVLSNSDRPVGH